MDGSWEELGRVTLGSHLVFCCQGRETQPDIKRQDATPLFRDVMRRFRDYGAWYAGHKRSFT